MTIWRMRIAFCVTKATNTHPEYVILIAFPRQQWLYEGTSMLRYTYIACLVYQAMWPSFVEIPEYNYDIQALNCLFHHSLPIPLSRAIPFVSVTDFGNILIYKFRIFHIQWTLELRPAWHTNDLGYDQNFSFDLRPKSWVTTRMPVKAKTRGCKQRPEMRS